MEQENIQIYKQLVNELLAKNKRLMDYSSLQASIIDKACKLIAVLSNDGNT